MGSFMMPIKDKGFYAFISAWAGKVIPIDFWIGLRAQTVLHSYNADETINPLIEDVLPTFSYSDGTPFDKANGYKLGASKITGECLFLKQSTSFGVTDSPCNKMKGFICQWNSKYLMVDVFFLWTSHSGKSSFMITF